MTSLIGTLIIGLIVGALAKLIMPGKDPGGCIITALLGIAGAYVGLGIAYLLRMDLEGGFLHFILSVIGAIIILAIYRAIIRKNNPSE